MLGARRPIRDHVRARGLGHEILSGAASERLVQCARHLAEPLGVGEKCVVFVLAAWGGEVWPGAVERVGPGVDGFRQILHQHAGNRAAAAILEADDAEERRRVRELGVDGQKPRQLDFRMLALFEFAKQLEYGLFAVDDRRIALLGRSDVNWRALRHDE